MKNEEKENISDAYKTKLQLIKSILVYDAVVMVTKLM